MFGMSMTEIAIIAIFALLVLGPGELPNAARTIGKTLRDFRRAGDDLRDTFEREVMQEKPPPKLRPVAEAVSQSLPAASPSEGEPAKESAAPAVAPSDAPAVSADATAPVDPSAKV